MIPKTKIICTIGPASSCPEVVRNLIKNGMSVARLNFSHGSHKEHLEKITLIRSISRELKIPVAILQDLCGPKIRVGKVSKPGVRLEPGQKFILTNEAVEGDQSRVSVSYRELPSDVKIGDQILLADGLMELTVKAASDTEVVCEVVIGGVLTSYKGINLPSGTLKADALTAKDQEDLRFGLTHDVDYVALSFVRQTEDILRVKSFIQGENKNTPVIAKIEKHEALGDMDGIIDASDGIMVARGDLGVEIPLEQVPGIQKKLVRKANARGKPVIVATQMLRSMVDALRPTRAEAADVANAILDGADAVMLSEETATGKYPAQAVHFMARIAKDTEKNYFHERFLKFKPKHGISQSVAYTSCVLAHHLDAAAIVAPTKSGSTAIHISRFKPKQHFLAFSPEKTTVRRLTLYWGCIPRHIDAAENTDEMIESAASGALETGIVSKGDIVVITAGYPVWVAGTTNVLKVKEL